MKLQLGLNNVSNREYHSDKDWLSSSSLKKLLKDPSKFYEEEILGNVEEREENPSFTEGSFTHSLILEPELIDKEYAFFDGLRKAGKEYEVFKQQNLDKVIISTPQKARCMYYLNGYKRNSSAVQLIQGGHAEYTICQLVNDVKIKVRCDYINLDKGYVVDVKTSSYPVDRDSFLLTIDQYQYNLSAALYTHVAELYYGRPFDFYFIAISKKDGDCQVFKVSKESKARGLRECIEAISLYKTCIASNRWEKATKELIEDIQEV